MQEMKVYTRTGDDGTTSLFSGKRVPKHDLRIKAYGTIDELNSWMGAIRDGANTAYQEDLIEIQKNLMTVGSQLANDSDEFPIQKIDLSDVLSLEEKIDQITDQLPALKNFVIPGGHMLISHAHLARAVCRRAERFITELKEITEVDSEILFYINRLSDYLFTLSRKFTFELKIEEIKWEPRGK